MKSGILALVSLFIFIAGASARAAECSEAQLRAGCSTLLSLKEDHQCIVLYYDWGIQRRAECAVDAEGKEAKRSLSCQVWQWEKNQVLFGWRRVGAPVEILVDAKGFVLVPAEMKRAHCEKAGLNAEECASHVTVDCKPSRK